MRWDGAPGNRNVEPSSGTKRSFKPGSSKIGLAFKKSTVLKCLPGGPGRKRVVDDFGVAAPRPSPTSPRLLFKISPLHILGRRDHIYETEYQDQVNTYVPSWELTAFTLNEKSSAYWVGLRVE